MGVSNKLKGKDLEILAKYEAGKTEFQLAIEYSVYPFAIRTAIQRARKQRQLVQPAIGK